MRIWTIAALITICGLAGSQPQDRYDLDPKWDLHRALWVGNGNEELARSLIESGVDVNLADGDDQLPIHWASLRGFDRIVQLLLKRGSEIHWKDNRAETPLHKASWQGNEKVVVALLLYGADSDLYSRNYRGMTPLDIAFEYGDRRIFELLDSVAKGYGIPNSNQGNLQHPVAGHGVAAVPVHVTSPAQVPVDVTSPVHVTVPKSTPTPVRVPVFLTTSQVSNTPNIPQIIEVQNSHTNACRKACDKYSKQLPADFNLRGLPAQPNQFPWMVALGYIDSNGSIQFKCSGTIISEQFILTAAHCTTEDNPPVVVRLGALNLADTRSTNGHIKEIIRHENFSTLKKQNDIALIRLTKNIVFTSDIRPACLETDINDKSSDIKLDVTGWGGSSDQGTKTPNELLKTQVTTLPLSQCKQIYSGQSANEINESQYCTNGASDICNKPWGNGGPLQIFRNQHTAHVVGIDSYGFCGAQATIVHTRVPYYLDWIAKHVWPNAS